MQEFLFAIEEYRENRVSMATNLAKYCLLALNKTRIKLSKRKYKIGDVVFLTSQIITLNWRMEKLVKNPFVVVKTPLDTESFKVYTLRPLVADLEDDHWKDFDIHEDFFSCGE